MEQSIGRLSIAYRLLPKNIEDTGVKYCDLMINYLLLLNWNNAVSMQ